MPRSVYVSMTGLRLRSPWQAPRFWFHALGAMAQARAASGLLRAEARRIDGVHHTLTVWESRDAMRAFLRTGAHATAMRVFPRFATGKVFGYAADAPPDWPDALALWQAHGRSV